MEIKYTNFDGDWNHICPYYGHQQKEHQTNLGKHEDVRYIHRQPCPQEQHQIRKRAVEQGIAFRGIIFFYDLAVYVWGLIPFKEEAKLIWQGIKHVFISIQAVIYLNRHKPK